MTEQQQYFSNLLLAASVGLALLFGMVMAYFVPPTITPIDFRACLNAVQGDISLCRYLEWVLWLYIPFLPFPQPIGFALWILLNVAGAVYAAHVFGRQRWVPVLSFQMLWLTFFGQIGGVIAGAGAWYWHHVNDRPLLAGCAAPLIVVKPQWGLPLVIIMGLIRADDWRIRIISAVPIFLVAALSFLLDPTWLTEMLTAIDGTESVRGVGILSLWQHIGAWTLLLWLPAVVAMRRLPDAQAITLAMATLALTGPLFRQSDLLLLFAMPSGLAPLLLGWLGLLGPEWDVILALVPLSVYVWLLYVAFRRPNVPDADTSSTAIEQEPST